MKKNIVLGVILLCFYSFTTFAQEKISIWNGLAPGTEDRENTEYWNEYSTNVREVFQPDLTLFIPENSDSTLTAVLICPGGGYNQVVMNKEGYKLAQWLNENNIAAFVLKYRLDPKEALQDARRAMSFIRSKADEFNIDKSKIGIMGFSAGAHLSCNLAFNHESKTEVDDIDSFSSRPDFLVGIYGVYNRIENYTENSSNDSDLPPMFLVHAGNDSKVPVTESINLYTYLHKIGVSAELHIYEYGEHGFALETNRGDEITSTVNSWSERLLEWMKLNNIL